LGKEGASDSPSRGDKDHKDKKCLLGDGSDFSNWAGGGVVPGRRGRRRVRLRKSRRSMLTFQAVVGGLSGSSAKGDQKPQSQKVVTSY